MNKELQKDIKRVAVALEKLVRLMTKLMKEQNDRINVGIPPAELVNQHLIAEHREIKRIPNCIAKGKYNMEGIPDKFKLGTGHVKFFYNKLLYLKNRYVSLYNECIKRGFNVQNYIGAWDNVPQELMNDYKVENNDIKIIKQRIDERRPNR